MEKIHIEKLGFFFIYHQTFPKGIVNGVEREGFEVN